MPPADWHHRWIGVVTGTVAPTLPGMGARETALADLWATGVAPGGHPTRFVRHRLDHLGVVTAAGLARVEPGRRVVVGGVVTHRQRPATASGTTFLNLEDETVLRTAVGEAALAASLVEAAAIIAVELGGAETDEGIVVTVPDDVFFDFDSAELRPGADATVADLSTLLDFYPDAPARVLGHTDSRGSDAYNLDLSERRATAVLDALVAAHGIDAARLTAEGRGEAEPVAPNEGSDGGDDPAGRQQNRRVELVIDTDQPLPG